MTNSTAPVLLAIEGSTSTLSIALQTGDERWHRRHTQGQSHTTFILADIQALLAQANLQLSDLSGIAWSAGPGSFTGLRIVASVVQALAFTHDLPVISLSSLQVLAQAVVMQVPCAKHILSLLNAHHRKTVYWGQYERLEEAVRPCGPDQHSALEAIILPSHPSPWYVVGDIDCSELNQIQAAISISIPPDFPLSEALLVLAWQALARKETVSAHQALPAYLQTMY